MDVAWVAFSAGDLAVFRDRLTSVGVGLVVAVATLVAIAVWAQLRGISLAAREHDPSLGTSHRPSASRILDVDRV